jgi:hypothetical protein
MPVLPVLPGCYYRQAETHSRLAVVSARPSILSTTASFARIRLASSSWVMPSSRTTFTIVSAASSRCRSRSSLLLSSRTTETPFEQAAAPPSRGVEHVRGRRSTQAV